MNETGDWNSMLVSCYITGDETGERNSMLVSCYITGDETGECSCAKLVSCYIIGAMRCVYNILH